MSLNKVMLIGNVGNDPEVRDVNGSKVATLRLATTERRKDSQGNPVETTEWHSIVAWNALAGVCENYIRKGSSLYVEGKIRTRSWQAQDGSTRYSTEIMADTIQMLGRREDNQQGQQQYQQRPQMAQQNRYPQQQGYARQQMSARPAMPMPQQTDLPIDYMP